MRPHDEQQGDGPGTARGRGQDTTELPGFGKRGDPGRRADTDPGPWGGPREGDGPGAPPPGAPVVAAPPKARTGLVLLIAFLVELVVIAGVGNQWVSDRLARHLNGSPFERSMDSLALRFAWRFTAPRSDQGHLFLAQMVGVGSVIVLSLLLILAVVRGPVTFGRAFFGIWMAVAVASMLGGYVRALIVGAPYNGRSQDGNRVLRAFFGPIAPGTVAFLAGVALGFLVALIAGLVARATRRLPQPAVVPGYGPVGPGGPGGPAPDGPYGPGGPGAPTDEREGAPWQDRRYGPPQREDERPGGRREDDERTTALPAAAAGAAGGAAAAHHERDRRDDERGARDDADATETTRLPAGGPGSPWGAPAGDEPRDEPRAEGGVAAPEGGAVAPEAGTAAPGASEQTAQHPVARDADEPVADRADQPADQPASEPPPQGDGRTQQLPVQEAPGTPAAQDESSQQGQGSSQQGQDEPPQQVQGQQPPPTQWSRQDEHPDQATTQFPRPPDDESLGDIEHRGR